MADDPMIDGTFGRLTYLVKGITHLANALEPLRTAAGMVAGTGTAGDMYAGEVSSLSHLAHAQHERLVEIARGCAHQLGWQVATYEIAPIAKESTDAISWITGNAYMPPLREFGLSNGVWNLGQDLPDVWESYVEGIESRLEELRVYMAAPDYDNALYVVDLARFEYVDDPDSADSLESEWRPIERP